MLKPRYCAYVVRNNVPYYIGYFYRWKAARDAIREELYL